MSELPNAYLRAGRLRYVVRAALGTAFGMASVAVIAVIAQWVALEVYERPALLLLGLLLVPGDADDAGEGWL